MQVWQADCPGSPNAAACSLVRTYFITNRLSNLIPIDFKCTQKSWLTIIRKNNALPTIEKNFLRSQNKKKVHLQLVQARSASKSADEELKGTERKRMRSIECAEYITEGRLNHRRARESIIEAYLETFDGVHMKYLCWYVHRQLKLLMMGSDECVRTTDGFTTFNIKQTIHKDQN